MKRSFLVVAPNLPTPDRASGDLRLSQMLKALVREFEVDFCAYGGARQRARLGEEAFVRYESNLSVTGIRVFAADPVAIAQQRTYDVVIFEFYFAAALYMAELRFRCPYARMVVDTVDIHFNRLQSQARLKGEDSGTQALHAQRNEELGVYAASDGLIVVSDLERGLLRQHGVLTPQFVIPNLHELPNFSIDRAPRDDVRLLFVGGFAHDPNVDAVLYFIREIWPLVLRQIPRGRLFIVGSNPTPDVFACAGPQVSVMGYVPDLAPVFADSDISIAPLRFGGGVKGKVGEAMAVGLPVVSTSIGIEGIGITHESEALVADNPFDFATQVVRLARDPLLYAELRTAARRYIETAMSAEKVGQLARSVLRESASLPLRRLSVAKRGIRIFRSLYERHVAWRFH